MPDENAIPSVAPKPEDDIIGPENEVQKVDQRKIEEWKAQYTTIFAAYHLGEPYVYRLFNYKEYKLIKANLAKHYQETQTPITVEQEMEAILKHCVLCPEDFAAKLDEGDIPGGLPSVMYESIMQASGFSELYPDIITNKQPSTI